MHDTALELGRRFFEAYLPPSGIPKILDIGSLDINGSLRQALPEGSTAAYVGVDLEAGSGVDVVIDDPAELPFPDDHFDAVVSTSCLEHDRTFWATVDEAVRVCKPGGFVYLNAPSNGHVHQHPLDCWRFYPDAGRALVTWVNGGDAPEVELMESFTFDRIACEWNDTIIIIGKLPVDRIPPPLCRDERARNICLRGHEGLGRYEPLTEDQRIMAGLGVSAHHLMATLRAETARERRDFGRPFFSIIVAYYQGETTDEELDRCLESVGDVDAEVIVLHDGPLLRPVPDRSLRNLRGKVHTTATRKNQFGHDLRDMGIRLARGLYLLHTNADNEYAPGALRELQAQLEAEPVGMLIAHCEMVGMSARPDGPVYELLPDGSRDPSKVLRLTGEPPRPGTIDLMQVALRRGLALEYGFTGRARTADGELYQKISEEVGYCRSPILIGRHH